MAKERESRVKSALGGKKKASSKKSSSKKGGKKHVHKMHITRTDNGKFLVNHEFQGGPEGELPPEGETHAINPEDLAQHVTDNMGVPPAGGAPAGGAPAGLPAGGAPPQPMMGA